jgi:hypothetical protein
MASRLSRTGQSIFEYSIVMFGLIRLFLGFWKLVPRSELLGVIFERPMQLTGTIQKKESGINKQVLDKLKVERERGITGMHVQFN